MHRIDGTNHLANLFALADPGAGRLTGTQVTPDWLNDVQENIAGYVEGQGVTLSKGDYGQLAVAIAANFASNLGALPIYPEIQTANNTLAITDNVDGTVTIDAAQAFLMRGWQAISTDDYSAGARTLSHAASLIYHLRFSIASGFEIFDTTDVAYNPTALVETDESFDSTADDVLVATITTDGSNVPTIVAERNYADRSSPMFDTGDFAISSQAGAASYFEGAHSMRRLPRRWVVLVKANGATGNSGFAGYLETSFIAGVAHTRDDNDDSGDYGGVVCAFRPGLFSVWVPDAANHTVFGRVVSVIDGWGGETNTVQIQNALIRVLAWS